MISIQCKYYARTIVGLVNVYLALLLGYQYVLQKKLDLWNRFVFVHGIGPSILCTVISLTIIGGTLYIGLAQ